MNVTSTSMALPATLVEALRRNAAAQARLESAATAGTAAPAGAAIAPVGVPRPTAAPSFSSTLEGALRSVSASQHQAGALADTFQSNPSEVGLEQAMVAMQKAQIGFQSALHVRNRLVSAYTDIMNMQV